MNWVEVGVVRVREALHELIDRRGLAVMALEIEVDACAESARPEQGLQHPHHLGALLVDRRGVEIADLVIGGGPHRMGEGAGILDELLRAQRAHIGDALDRRASAGRR